MSVSQKSFLISRNGKMRFRKPVMFKAHNKEDSLGGGGFRTPIKAYPRKFDPIKSKCI